MIMALQFVHNDTSFQQTNTFQGVLAVSGNDVYGIGLYADGLMQWATSDQEHATPWCQTARVSFENINDGTTLPGSGTCSVLHAASLSNVNVPGMFVVPTNNSLGSYKDNNPGVCCCLHVHSLSS